MIIIVSFFFFFFFQVCSFWEMWPKRKFNWQFEFFSSSCPYGISLSLCLYMCHTLTPLSSKPLKTNHVAINNSCGWLPIWICDLVLIRNSSPQTWPILWFDWLKFKTPLLIECGVNDPGYFILTKKKQDGHLHKTKFIIKSYGKGLK